MIGQQFGPYQVVAKLGAGGMGEVYRARDTKLNRDVALKILPEAFASDPDRLMRFTREAQTLASLNHPNIAGIYGMSSEAISGAHQPEIASELVLPVRALVMELVEGDDLSVRVARGPMSIDDALPIARQIAEALEAALQQFATETPYQHLPDTPKDLAAELEAWARDHHKHLHKLRALIRTSMGEFEENPEQCKQAMCVSISIANELTDYLTTAQRAGLASPDFVPSAATAMLMGTLFSDAMGRDPMPERYPYAMRDGITHYLQLFLRAIGAKGENT